MHPVGPIDTRALFRPLHAHLISLLRNLSETDWQLPTVCAGWTVKDIGSHVLDGCLRRIAYYRDGYSPQDSPVIDSYQALVRYLNQLNQDWVVATRRLSPAILTDWLELAGAEADDLLIQLPFDEPALHAVAWAGEDTSPNWFHIAREYTELWHHQQQIRLAVGQTAALMTSELYHPLLDTFMRALPYNYRQLAAPVNTLVQVSVSGVGGGDWFLHRQTTDWQLVILDRKQAVDALITIDGTIAWRLFTKGITTENALPYITISGDSQLVKPVLTMLAVMA
ncbi:maleylpyruvate isomerase N-terminal domain-containing protein [Fibrella sp. HMF5335]|uniref:Maleylpyruvate isomerase N-terminal domain-containing protein n=1 Tax=Fibrella rubiginis TaxID=2817060 RepID=A0A939K532_9BACT|nr:maleylpyruvate isomerase N-terminal domain-containing protein [Fibrella rubiginis]MBO0936836.1 maleylpyruvate isomerase N-terminal domain-containing protein [Fibrella rubiginis]